MLSHTLLHVTAAAAAAQDEKRSWEHGLLINFLRRLLISVAGGSVREREKEILDASVLHRASWMLRLPQDGRMERRLWSAGHFRGVSVWFPQASGDVSWFSISCSSLRLETHREEGGLPPHGQLMLQRTSVRPWFGVEIHTIRCRVLLKNQSGPGFSGATWKQSES